MHIRIIYLFSEESFKQIYFSPPLGGKGSIASVTGSLVLGVIYSIQYIILYDNTSYYTSEEHSQKSTKITKSQLKVPLWTCSKSFRPQGSIFLLKFDSPSPLKVFAEFSSQ